jgi:quercetin dioxygenase-like cupin family protein
MDITRAGSQPSGKGPADWFTGTVRIDPLFAVAELSRAVANTVTFEPSARTAWHTHPLGQMLDVPEPAAQCRAGECGDQAANLGRGRRSLAP